MKAKSFLTILRDIGISMSPIAIYLILSNYLEEQPPEQKPPDTQPPPPVPNPEEPCPIFNPKRDLLKPTLWKYYPDKSHEIWIARNYKDYIIPQNEAVKYLAEKINFIEELGFISIKFKCDNKPVYFAYRKDDGRLCDKSGQSYQECYGNQDFWMNPDYYIWNNLEGDCEDYALLMASIFENTSIPYMIVNGTRYGIEDDFWIETVINNKVYMGQINTNGGSLLREIDHISFRPHEMFNKYTDIQPYQEWYLPYITTFN